jgi:ligand-binding sensor domain-containing protein
MVRVWTNPARKATGLGGAFVWLAVPMSVLLALSMPSPAQGQTSSTLPGAWATFDSSDGLPDGEVLAVWGAPDGTLWAGTAAGVVRFDGVAWQDFEEDAQALRGAVRAVWGSGNQTVWAAGDAGLANFDGLRWQQISAETLGLRAGPRYALWGHGKDDLWVGGQGGVAHFDGETWRAFTSQSSGLPAGTVQALAGNADGSTVWIGTDAGLARYEPDSDRWSLPELQDVDLISVEPLMRSRLEDVDLAELSVESLWLTDNVLWVGLWNGLLRHDLTTGAWSMMDGSQWNGPDVVSSIWSADDSLWLAVSQPEVMVADFEYMQILKSRGEDGLRRFDGSRWHPDEEGDPLYGDRIHAIWSDGGGVLWFATSDGMTRFDQERWRTYSRTSPTGQRVDVVRGDAAGHLWFGGLDALYAWQDERWTRDLPPGWSEPLIWALLAEKPDDVWIGSWGNGAAHWDGVGWEQFSEGSGLPSNMVNAIWRDASGSIWFGTSRGLCHLDRNTGEWETFTGANSGLPHDWVTALWGAGQALWVGTLGGGAARYEPALEQWEAFQPAGLVDNDVRSLALDGMGNLWVATAGGVAYHDRASGSWQQWPAADILPPFEEPRAVTVAPDGVVWLSGAVQGVHYYVPGGEGWQPFAPDWLDSTVERIWASSDGELWFATMGGAIRYDPRTGDWLELTVRDGLTSDDVRAIWGDQAGTLWFATKFGVSRLADGGWQTFTSAEGLASANTLLLTGDNDGNVWVATLAGIDRYTDGAWQETLSWPTPPVLWRDLYAPGQGRLWAVAADGTLHHFDGRDWSEVAVADDSPAGQVQAVVEGPDGELWVGSRQGLAHRPVGGTSWSHVTTGLIDNGVNAIWGDGGRYVWFATEQGISRYEVGTGAWLSFSTADGLLSDNVTDLWGDDQGHVWAAQDWMADQFEGGVSLFDGQGWHALPGEGLPSTRVNSVWVDDAGILWAATMGGPAWWDGSRWQPPPAGPGISGEVHTLWAAADGLWVAATDSVTHYDGDQWQTYSTADGVPAGELHAVWSDGQGGAWVGGQGGLARLDDGRWAAVEAVPGEVKGIWGRDASDVWVATSEAVSHFDGMQWQLSLADAEATALTGDGQGGLWLGTTQGLRHYDGQTWELVAEPRLPPGAVTHIQQAPGGTTWVGMEQGVYGFGGPEKATALKGGAVRALLADRASTLWFAESDDEVQRVDQLPPLRIFYGDVRAIAEDAKGDIWFGTGDGLLRYRPRPPAASIERVELASGQPVQTVGRQIKLPYSPGKVTVTLVATDTASPTSELAFWYRLDPQESDWKRWDSYPFRPPDDKRRQISYDGLEPGAYTFYMGVYNATNDTAGKQAWTLEVGEPPLWVTVREHPAFPWMLGVIGLVLLAVGGGGLRLWQTRRAYGYRDVQITAAPGSAADIHRIVLEADRGPFFPAYESPSDPDLMRDPLQRLRQGETNEATLRFLGESLYAGLFSPTAETHLRKHAALGRRGVRLRLRFEDTPSLAALPWEFLHGGDDLRFLAVQADVALVRDLSPEKAEGAPRTRPPLKLLVAWAMPQDLQPLDVAEEVAVIEEAFARQVARGRAHVQVLAHARPETFVPAVQEGYDLIHFIGHGGVQDGGGVLYFEDEDGDAVSMAQAELVALLAEMPTFTDKTPKLVVLNACRTAEPVMGKSLMGLAEALVVEGRVPAVVGMGYPVTGRSAAVFSRAFYETLVRHGQVDHAVTVGREALFVQVEAGQRDWGVPRLVMRIPRGVIFELT